MEKRQQSEGILLLAINLLARIPFLFAGYGKEEDAWSNVLNAQTIALSGRYEVSRLPGHPFYELLLSKLYPLNHTPWLFNGISMLASALAIYATYQAMRLLRLPHAFWVSLSLSFIPVFFIAGTYTIDYNLALALIMSSFVALLKKRLPWSGILLGLATGIRISSIGFLLPWLIWLLMERQQFQGFLRLMFSALAVSAMAFLLPYLTYGLGFLDFHKPPFPSWANILYKLSIGIWGLPLLVYFVWLKLGILHQWRSAIEKHKALFVTLLLAMLMQLAVFLRLPFKSEFFIPALPFGMMIFALVISKKQAQGLAGFALLSCLIMGFDYNKSVRSSVSSPLSWDFKAGGKTIQFDLIKGPVFIDHSKRVHKSEFVDEVIHWSQQQEYPYHVIAGWYWPEIVYKLNTLSETFPAEAAKNFDYLSTEEELLEALTEGKELYFLPEINEANANVYEHYLADSLAQEWKPLP